MGVVRQLTTAGELMTPTVDEKTQAKTAVKEADRPKAADKPANKASKGTKDKAASKGGAKKDKGGANAKKDKPMASKGFFNGPKKGFTILFSTLNYGARLPSGPRGQGPQLDDCLAEWTVLQLNKQLQRQWPECSTHHVKMVHNGRELTGSTVTLKECGLTEDCELHLIRGEPYARPCSPQRQRSPSPLQRPAGALDLGYFSVRGAPMARDSSPVRRPSPPRRSPSPTRVLLSIPVTARAPSPSRSEPRRSLMSGVRGPWGATTLQVQELQASVDGLSLSDAFTMQVKAKIDTLGKALAAKEPAAAKEPKCPSVQESGDDVDESVFGWSMDLPVIPQSPMLGAAPKESKNKEKAPVVPSAKAEDTDTSTGAGFFKRTPAKKVEKEYTDKTAGTGFFKNCSTPNKKPVDILAHSREVQSPAQRMQSPERKRRGAETDDLEQKLAEMVDKRKKEVGGVLASWRQ